MTSSILRAALLVSILAGAVGGCASSQARGQSAVEPQSKPEEQTEVDPIVKLLRARSPGLMVTRTASGDIAVQLVQGRTSFYGSSDPLYVLDDVPFRPGLNGALTGVNPYDIESIKALTRPEDVAIYGVRGANGVIVITTKKPAKN
jgi:TonB-dependent SusC/RagA subfamily outer membrane receptor